MKAFFFILGFIALGNYTVQAQCTPNYSYSGDGFYTNDGDSTLDVAYINATYLENVSLYVPKTYNFGGFPLSVDSVKINDIQGLPDGIGSVCNPINCFWVGGDTGCIALSGTPTNPAQVGENQLTIKMTFFGLGGFSRNEDVRIFKLNVLDTTNTNTSVGAMLVSETLKAYPNPVKDVLKLSFSEESRGLKSFQLTDLSGRKLLEMELGSGVHDYELDLSAFPNGMYVLNLNESGAVSSKRISIQH